MITVGSPRWIFLTSFSSAKEFNNLLTVEEWTEFFDEMDDHDLRCPPSGNSTYYRFFLDASSNQSWLAMVIREEERYQNDR